MQSQDSFVEPPNVIQEASTEHLIAGINWFVKMNDTTRWNLTQNEAAELLGGISVSKYLNLKRKAAKFLPINVTRDLSDRISLFLGIWEASQLVVPDNRTDLAYKLFNQPNTSHILEGKTIKQYLLDRKSMEALYVVKRYLNAISI